MKADASSASSRSFDPSSATDSIFEAVCSQIRAVLPQTEACVIGTQTLLIEELGLDSLKFVDLTVGIEDALGLSEFPMQEWLDLELAAGRPLCVGSLAEACRSLAASKLEFR